LEFFISNINLKKSLNETHITYIFSSIDENKNNFIEKKELRQFFQLGMSEEDEELIQNMIDEADEDKDDMISLKEFKNIINSFYDNLSKK
jgi:Ca2+-binding EF-hand superfamily protein